MVHPYLRRRRGWNRSPIRARIEAGAGAHAGRADLPGAGDADGDAGGRLHAGRSRSAAPRDGGLEAQRRTARSTTTASSTACWSAATSRSLPNASSSRSRASANTAFPESHAASFALLVYVSSWLKCHEPAAFLAALLNSQPMGFYSPSQLVQDAQRHGVEVLPVDVTMSGWDSALERACARAQDSGRQPRCVSGLSLLRGHAQGRRGRAYRSARAVRPFVERAATWRGARNSIGMTCRCWRAPMRWRRSPATAARRCGRRWRAVPDKDMLRPTRRGRRHRRTGRAVGRRRTSSATTARRA